MLQLRKFSPGRHRALRACRGLCGSFHQSLRSESAIWVSSALARKIIQKLSERPAFVNSNYGLARKRKADQRTLCFLSEGRTARRAVATPAHVGLNAWFETRSLPTLTRSYPSSLYLLCRFSRSLHCNRS